MLSRLKYEGSIVIEYVYAPRRDLAQHVDYERPRQNQGMIPIRTNQQHELTELCMRVRETRVDNLARNTKEISVTAK